MKIEMLRINKIEKSFYWKFYFLQVENGGDEDGEEKKRKLVMINISRRKQINFLLSLASVTESTSFVA